MGSLLTALDPGVFLTLMKQLRKYGLPISSNSAARCEIRAMLVQAHAMRPYGWCMTTAIPRGPNLLPLIENELMILEQCTGACHAPLRVMYDHGNSQVTGSIAPLRKQTYNTRTVQ